MREEQGGRQDGNYTVKIKRGLNRSDHPLTYGYIHGYGRACILPFPFFDAHDLEGDMI